MPEDKTEIRDGGEREGNKLFFPAARPISGGSCSTRKSCLAHAVAAVAAAAIGFLFLLGFAVQVSSQIDLVLIVMDSQYS